MKVAAGHAQQNFIRIEGITEPYLPICLLGFSLIASSFITRLSQMKCNLRFSCLISSTSTVYLLVKHTFLYLDLPCCQLMAEFLSFSSTHFEQRQTCFQNGSVPTLARVACYKSNGAKSNALHFGDLCITQSRPSSWPSIWKETVVPQQCEDYGPRTEHARVSKMHSVWLIDSWYLLDISMFL